MSLIRPIAASQFSPKRAFAALLDNLSRLHQNRVGNLDAERLGGFEIDDSFKFERLFDGQVAGFRPLEYLVRIDSDAAIQVSSVRRVRNQASRVNEIYSRIYHWQTVLRCVFN